MTPAAPASKQQTPPEQLRLEARALGRFILGGRRDIDPEFIDRYIQAHNHLFTGPQPPKELSLVRFAANHPLLLRCLDAAVAFRQPNALLHKKALLMAAILEASPRYADEFLPRRCGWMGLAWLVARISIGTAAALVIGLPALLIVRGRA